MKKTILIGALAPLEDLAEDANPVVVIVEPLKKHEDQTNLGDIHICVSEIFSTSLHSH